MRIHSVAPAALKHLRLCATQSLGGFHLIRIRVSPRREYKLNMEIQQTFRVRNYSDFLPANHSAMVTWFHLPVRHAFGGIHGPITLSLSQTHSLEMDKSSMSSSLIFLSSDVNADVKRKSLRGCLPQTIQQYQIQEIVSSSNYSALTRSLRNLGLDHHLQLRIFLHIHFLLRNRIFHLSRWFPSLLHR